ncbi:MAG: hypothetical protein KC621_16940 [Myxococcales bacterium]|nr:hypothetical protein [Myxococcales bacterium]
MAVRTWVSLALLAGCHATPDGTTDLRPAPTDQGTTPTDTSTTHTGTWEHSGTTFVEHSAHTAEPTEPFVCPPVDVDVCGNGIDDDADGRTDCALEGITSTPTSVAVTLDASGVFPGGDLNGDGVQDLIGWTSIDNPVSRHAVSVFHGPIPAGTAPLLPAGSAVAQGFVMREPIVSDLDHDGALDVVMGVGLVGASCNAAVPWEVYRFPITAISGSVDAATVAVGTLRKPAALAGSTNAIYVSAIGDVNGNGSEDLMVQIIANCSDWQVHLVDSASIVGEVELDTVSFARVDPGAGTPSRAFDLGDVDGDGLDDLVLAFVDGQGDGQIRVWPGGSLPSLVRVADATQVWQSAGSAFFENALGGHDLTRDGTPDAVVSGRGDDGAVWVVELPTTSPTLNLETDAWSTTTVPPGATVLSRVGDLNGDGAPDLTYAVFQDAVRVDHAPCPGTHALPVDGATSLYPAHAVFDATGDGIDDIVITMETTYPWLGFGVFAGGSRP